jgi:hypothetical protein
MNNITPEQALENLYKASRVAPLSATEHDLLKQSALVLNEIISPKKKDKTEEPKKEKKTEEPK